MRETKSAGRKRKGGAMVKSANFSEKTEMNMGSDYFSIINDPFKNIAELYGWFSAERRAKFLLCNAGTKASEHSGISAAGADPLARRLTPAVDAEALVLGKTISAKGLPVSPRGIVSPVVISRACLKLLELDIQVVNCGSFESPKLEGLLQLSEIVAECPSSGHALAEELVADLFKQGTEIGKELADTYDYLMLAECVPGGTTTAMAVMHALGYEIKGLVSSSLPTCNHSQRWQLVETGIASSGYTKSEFAGKPLLAVSSVGDPMQAVLAGIVSTATKKCKIFLAGGSQMLAIWALCKSLLLPEFSLKNIVIMSTKWVAFDKSAGVQKLAELLQAPMAVACPNFWNSRHRGLQAYEEGNVKEGVGAGASMCVAHLNRFTREQIQNAIDDCYDELVH